MNWLNETYKLLDRVPRHISLYQLSERCDVGSRWLSTFYRRYSSDYGISRVQKVHDTLKVMEAEGMLLPEPKE